MFFNTPGSCSYTLSQLSMSLETITTSLPSQYLIDCSNSTTNNQIFELMTNLLLFINQTNFNRPEDLINKLTMLSSFSPWMEFIPSTLFVCTETCLTLATFLQEPEVGALDRGEYLSDMTVNVRRKAIMALAKLGYSVPDMFIPHLESLGPVVVELCKSGKLVKQEIRIVIEFLVVVISGSKVLGAEEKRIVMGSVVQEDMDFLSNCGNMFDGFEGFVKGLVPVPFEKWSKSDGSLSADLVNEFDRLFQIRRNFYNTLLSVRHWMKRSCEVAKKFKIDISGLWIDHQSKFLQVIFSLMGNINTLFDPASWAILPAPLKKVLTLTPHERAMALGVDHEDAKGLNKPVCKTALDNEIFKIWSWIGRCRDIWYFKLFILVIKVFRLFLNFQNFTLLMLFLNHS
jgi:Exportin-5 family